MVTDLQLDDAGRSLPIGVNQNAGLAVKLQPLAKH